MKDNKKEKETKSTKATEEKSFPKAHIILSELLPYTVYPSNERTIAVYTSKEEAECGYKTGCHKYVIENSVGYNNGKYEYVGTNQTIQFIQKLPDGTVIPGVQSEQLALVLLYRLEIMNKLFPCEENNIQIQALDMYLTACRKRVESRIEKDVMGKLEK